MKTTCIFFRVFPVFCVLICSCTKTPRFSVDFSEGNSEVVINKVCASFPLRIDSASCSDLSGNFDPEIYKGGFAALDVLRKRGVKVRTLSPNLENYFDFNDFFPSVKEPSCVYLFFNVYSSQAKTVVFGFNFAQQMEVWLNSENIFACQWKRNIKKQVENHIVASLAEGDNTVVVKLSQTEVEKGVSHWEFYCSVQDELVARSHYRNDYWCDFVVDPVIEGRDDSVEIYLGPYAYSEKVGFALYDLQDCKQFGVDRNTLPAGEAGVVERYSSWKVALPEGLSDGLYRSELSLPDTVLAEYCFIGEIDPFFDALVSEVYCESGERADAGDYVSSLQQRYDHLKEQRSAAYRVHDVSFNSRNKLSTLLQLQDIDRAVSSGSTLRNRPGTFLKKYVSPSDSSEQYYLFHISPQLCADSTRKVPLVIYMPYYFADPPIMPLSWYISDIDFLSWEYRLADEYGFALLFPYLRAQLIYNAEADTDLNEALSDLKRHYAIDDRGIYLLGGCAGGTKALSACQRNPALAAGVGVSNGIYPDYLIDSLNKLPAQTYLFISHSRNNEIPISQADKFVEKAKKYNNRILYRRVENEGHFNPAENRDELFFRYFSDIYRSPVE
ncbi:MAG: hypothetical protein PUB21_11760 [Bacteroidales bacterium]|nr:hypothetical protein [Bacteroidales bacterium]